VATGLLHGESVNLEAVVDEFMPALIPQISIKLLSVYVGPVQDLLLVVPKRAFAAQVSVIRDNLDWRLLPRSLFFPQISFHDEYRTPMPNE
jgi:hypothetical protein